MKSDRITGGIKQMSPGQPFSAFCMVRGNILLHGKNGSPYLELELGDQSGRLKARVWDNFERYAAIAQPGCIVKIRAEVRVYQGRKTLNILELRAATPADGIKPEQLLPTSRTAIQALNEKLTHHCRGIQNPHLNGFLKGLFSNEQLADAYLKSPAGKLWHHNYIGGMLEHIIKLLEHSEIMKAHYPEINIDLLKTGIICHGIGKLQEYTLEGFIELSTDGRLIGNKMMGYTIIHEQLAQYPEFPLSLSRQLRHLLLSHDCRTSAEGVTPMTLEAVVMQHLILLDAHANAVVRIQETDIPDGSEWSKYISLLDRFIYRDNSA